MNDRIAKQIWHDALQCSMKPFSWGLHFNDIKVIENGTSFYVQGMVCGWIKVQQDTTDEYTLQEMADTLNQEGFVTSKGCSFFKSTIYKLIKRYNLK